MLGPKALPRAEERPPPLPASAHPGEGLRTYTGGAKGKGKGKSRVPGHRGENWALSLGVSLFLIRWSQKQNEQ